MCGLHQLVAHSLLLKGAILRVQVLGDGWILFKQINDVSLCKMTISVRLTTETGSPGRFYAENSMHTDLYIALSV